MNQEPQGHPAGTTGDEPGAPAANRGNDPTGSEPIPAVEPIRIIGIGPTADGSREVFAQTELAPDSTDREIAEATMDIIMARMGPPDR